MGRPTAANDPVPEYRFHLDGEPVAHATGHRPSRPETSIAPDWPSLMSIETVGAYLDMSASSARTFLARNGIGPVTTGMSLARWRVRDIDACIDRLPVRGEVPVTPVEADPLALAERNLARRNARRR
jgi:hypothetical protein